MECGDLGTDPVSHHLLIRLCRASHLPVSIQDSDRVRDVTIVKRLAHYLIISVSALAHPTILQVEALSQIVVVKGVFGHDGAGFRVGSPRRDKPWLIKEFAVVTPPD